MQPLNLNGLSQQIRNQNQLQNAIQNPGIYQNQNQSQFQDQMNFYQPRKNPFQGPIGPVGSTNLQNSQRNPMNPVNLQQGPMNPQHDQQGPKNPKKLPVNYPMQDDADNLFNGYEWFEILGTSSDADLQTIDKAYKKLILKLHPDKKLSEQAKKMGWTEQDKLEAFENVRKAYAFIKGHKKKMDKRVPDYDMPYNVESDYKIGNPEAMGLDPKEVAKNPAMFNQQFDRHKKKQEMDGFGNPMDIGYSHIFKNGLTEEEKQNEIKMIRAGQARPNIDVPINPKQQKIKTNPDGTIVRHNPLDKNSFALVSNNLGFSELGIKHIGDFSVTVQSSKNSLSGSDLMAVYGSNKEYWEDSFMRDKELAAKFTDTTQVDKKLNIYQNERNGFDAKTVDPQIMRQLNEEERRYALMEKARIKNQMTQDQYYNQRFIGDIPGR